MKRLLIILLALIPGILSATGTYEYVLDWDNPASHYYRVTITTEADPSGTTVFQMPVWRPGRYIRQDYAASVSEFNAQADSPWGGQLTLIKKISPSEWEVSGKGKLIVTYKVYANNMDAGSSTLNTDLAYFNPVNLFMHVKGDYDRACTLEVPKMERDWKAATALTPDPKHYNRFSANDYHEFVDSPTILSPNIVSLKYEQHGTTFHLHFSVPSMEDDVKDRILQDIPKISEAAYGVFNDFYFKDYHFIYLLTPLSFRHAVEHTNSACFSLPATVVQSERSVAGIYGITAHEFWHAWNVKRIRPSGIHPYDYQTPQYTPLHWFTEGVTEYYTQLLLVRAGLIDRKEFYSRAARNIEYIENSYAAANVSPAESSFDSWLATSDYGDPHLRTSYYTLGQRIGMLLDLSIRQESEGGGSLDEVFRMLASEFYSNGKGYSQEDLRELIVRAYGAEFNKFFTSYIYDTKDFEYAELLQYFGLEIDSEVNKDPTLNSLGILQQEIIPGGMYVKYVRPGSAFENAGFGDGSYLISLGDIKAEDLAKADLSKVVKKGKKVKGERYENGTAVPFTLVWEGDGLSSKWSISEKEKLSETEEARLASWLGGRTD